MKQQLPSTSEYTDHPWLRQREPYSFMLNVALLSMGLVFFALSALYVDSLGRGQGGKFSLPWAFWASTLAMLGCSFMLRRANHAFKTDEFAAYTQWLRLTMGMAVLFALCQFLGWRALLLQNVLLQNNLAGAFIYVISGLHLLHLAGGMVFLGIALHEASRRRDYVEGYIYSVNPPNLLRLRLLTRYWHFVDGVWLYLFVIFLLTQGW